MEKHPVELTILMPCLNEAQTLETCIRKAQSFLAEYKVQGEILVADNGSSDGSPDIAARLGARVVHVSHRGYGSALITGIEAAQGTYIIMGDADDSYDFSDLDLFLRKLRKGYDLVMGNRFMGGIRPGAMPFLHKYIGNPALSFLGQLFFNSQIHDFHCGLRGMKRESIRNLELKTTGMEFATEMVVKSTLKELKITEVPVVLYPDGRIRKPHLKTWSDGWRHLRFMLFYSPRWLFLYPGIVFLLVGTFAEIRLAITPFVIGRIGFDIHTLLYASLVVQLGFQMVFFAIFSRVFAMRNGLLPQDQTLNRLFKVFRLEIGVLIGLFLSFIGTIGAFLVLQSWYAVSFSELNPTIIMRLAIPSVTLIGLGFQVILSSFLFSYLGLEQE